MSALVRLVAGACSCAHGAYDGECSTCCVGSAHERGWGRKGEGRGKEEVLTCFAKAVMVCCTTIIARCTERSFIFVQYLRENATKYEHQPCAHASGVCAYACTYVRMGFTPTLASSGKKTNICSVGSSFLGSRMVSLSRLHKVSQWAQEQFVEYHTMVNLKTLL